MLLSISFEFDYFPLLVVATIAWFVPMALTFFKLNRIPAVIVEILAGYFIGRYFLGSYPEENMRILEFLALTGFIFLMFLSGLEIEVDKIIASFPRRKLSFTRFLMNPFLVGILIFVLTLLLSLGGGQLISHFVELKSIWFFSLIMVTTSVGIILPVLKNRGEVNTRFGQMIILAAAVADIMSIILFTITALVIKKGLTLDSFLILSLPLIFILFYFVGSGLTKFSFFKKISFQLSHAASQIKVRGTILLILIFVVLSQYIGTEVILLGAFLVGLLLSLLLHKDRSLLIIKLDGMGYGFFIPVFFIMVGISFNADAFKEFDDSLLVVFILVLITLFAVKVLPSLVWSRLFGFKRAVAGGFLISSRLSLIIAASAIGMELGVISSGMNALIILMAVITCLLSPVLFNQINPKSRFPADKTVIVGGSSTGVLLARRLKLHNKDVIMIESDESRFLDINQKGIQCIHGDGCDVSIYDKIKLYPQNYVVVLTDSDDLNIRISEVLRQQLNHEQIITKANKQGIQRILKRMEVEFFDATRVVATTIENLIMRPTTYHALVESFDNYYVEEIKITNKGIDGLQIKEVPFHKDCTLMLIRRGTNMYIPHGETYLRIGDIVNVFGTSSALEDIRVKLV